MSEVEDLKSEVGERRSRGTPLNLTPEDIPRTFPVPSFNTLGSFISELCSGQTNRDKSHNGLEHLTDRPTRPTESALVITLVGVCDGAGGVCQSTSRRG